MADSKGQKSQGERLVDERLVDESYARVRIASWILVFLAAGVWTGFGLIKLSLPGAAVDVIAKGLGTLGIKSAVAAVSASVLTAIATVVLPALFFFIGFRVWYRKLSALSTSEDPYDQAIIDAKKNAAWLGQLLSVLVPLVGMMVFMAAGLTVSWPVLVTLIAIPLVLVAIRYAVARISVYIKFGHGKLGSTGVQEIGRDSGSVRAEQHLPGPGPGRDPLSAAWADGMAAMESGRGSQIREEKYIQEIKACHDKDQLATYILSTFHNQTGVHEITENIAQALIDRGMDVEMVNAAQADGRNLFACMVVYGLDTNEGRYDRTIDPSAIKLFLNHFQGKLEIDDKDGHGYPPLFWALEDGHLDVAQWLIEAGADTSLVPESVTLAGSDQPSTKAYENLQKLFEVHPDLRPKPAANAEEITRMVSEGGPAAPVDEAEPSVAAAAAAAAPSEPQATLAEAAARAENSRIVDDVKSEVCLVNDRHYKNGSWTALHVAIKDGHVNLCKWLLEEKNADPKVKTGKKGGGFTAIHLAQQSGVSEGIRELFGSKSPSKRKQSRRGRGGSPAKHGRFGGKPRSDDGAGGASHQPPA